MKIRVMIAAWAVLELAAQAKSKKNENDRSSQIDVYVHLNFFDAGLAFGRAEGIAAEMLSQTGVRIRWRLGLPKNEQGIKPIIIDFTSNTPESLAPGAMGYAQMYDDEHIRIFWDRVKTNRDPSLIAPLLAHVLAHEIAHILQDCSHHSQTGVMKARWTSHDVVAMAEKPLRFEPIDVELIHDGLARRRLQTRPTPARSAEPRALASGVATLSIAQHWSR